MVSTSPLLLHVGLSAWIIQDGNYGDFAVGQQAKFALEFGELDGLGRADEGPPGAIHLNGSRYRVRARVAFVAAGVWVIDAGSFMAYGERPPDDARVGAWVEGDVYVGIDPFFYFEGLYKIVGMPSLSYSWLVREILRETTPWRDGVLPNGTQVRCRDETKEAYAPTSATDAWQDDDGHGHYVLGCVQQGEPGPP